MSNISGINTMDQRENSRFINNSFNKNTSTLTKDGK
jgi:hypothetical protein